METLEESYNVGLQGNNAGYNTEGALRVRLDPTTIIENVELFLRGTKLVVQQDDEGNISTQSVSLGKPRANDIGIQAILNWLQLILNPQTVQGNFAVDSPNYSSQYAQYIFDIRLDLSQIILENMYEWGVSEQDLALIVDSIMSAVEPYMTRLIDNKERESYQNTITHNERSTVQEPKSNLLNLFSR